MYVSIQGVLQFQIYQIPMVGADTCGVSESRFTTPKRAHPNSSQMKIPTKNFATDGCNSPPLPHSTGTTTTMVLYPRNPTDGIASRTHHVSPLLPDTRCYRTGCVPRGILPKRIKILDGSTLSLPTFLLTVSHPSGPCSMSSPTSQSFSASTDSGWLEVTSSSPLC